MPIGTVVQIGTNNGRDHVRDLCRTSAPEAVYLVEPFSIHAPEIRRQYDGIANVTLDTIAITPTHQDSVRLFYTEEDGPEDNANKSYQVASIIPSHIVKHHYDPRLFKSVVVPAMTLNEYFASHSLTDIDYLFLDIEGIDFEVLRTIDFSTYTIRHLQIEHLHLNSSDLNAFMQSQGYTSTPGIDWHGFDTLFVRTNAPDSK